MPIDRFLYLGVPEDFPIAAMHSDLGGVQPKLSVVKEDGRYYALGTRLRRSERPNGVCEDLVQRMPPYCKRKLDRFNGNQESVLSSVFAALVRLGAQKDRARLSGGCIDLA